MARAPKAPNKQPNKKTKNKGKTQRGVNKS